MLLKQLKLHNFGLYGGENHFNLSPGPDGDKPIILVRGHNGGGKTTFLEAVRLALYGKRALGARVARADYEAYLMQRIHTMAEDRCASVELAFSRQENGDNFDFTIIRSWVARGATVVDTVELSRNGVPIDDIPAEDWDHYLEDMIPPGISQLFFFDGEKIQDIADGGPEKSLRESVRSLLGLDLINQLRSDLTVYTSRRDPSSSGVDIEAIERDLKEAREALVLLEEEAAQNRSDQHQAFLQIDQAQKVFRNEGGVAALDHSELKKALKEVEKRISLLQGDLKHLAEGPLPLGLAPCLVDRLIKKVEDQRTVGHSGIILAFLKDFSDNQRTKKSNQPAWTKSHFTALKRYIETRSHGNGRVKLDADPIWILSRLQRVDGDLQDEAARLAKAIDTAKQHQSQLKLQLKGFDADAATDALEQLKTAEYRLGAAETQLAEKERRISSLRHRIDQLEKERARAINVEFDVLHAIHKIDLGERARAALADYECRIQKRRLENLSHHFVSCFNGLVRKTHLVKEVRIDPDSFEINLIDTDGIDIPKNALSAGERQIFAISMLWALGKTSGRELPVIIDTPLSRLDKDHRRAIIEAYVPYASQQVILLCTDSELTKELDELVSPFVARRYQIGVQDERRQTFIATHKPEAIYAH